ncbi:MAG TPA: DMT family transporter [Xanthomonadaceae bacterium]|jgi:drug/metabolite transporter (DMT)-like permease|nr:DMT family transporter [Xanthomonadaceae bacterium]
MRIGLGELLSIGSAAAWAAGVILYRRLGDMLPPLTLNFLKNALVLAMLLPVVAWLYATHPPEMGYADIVLSLLSGLLGLAVADTLYFSALNALGAGRMGVIGNFYSPFVLTLSFAFLGERLSATQGIGFVLVSAGVLLVARPATGWRGIDGSAQRRGATLGICAMALMAVGIVLAKPILERQPLLWVTATRMIGGLAGMLVIAAIRGQLGQLLPTRNALAGREKLHWPTLVLAAFLGQGLSMLLWLGGYKYTKASVAAVLNETSSVFILLFAAWWLREPLTRRSGVGVTLTLSGIVCMLTQGH